VRFEALTRARRTDAIGGEDEAAADLVALQDSALLHARNLIDFASASPDSGADAVEWALIDIIGTKRRKIPTRLSAFLNEWVVNLGDLGATKARWPKDADGNVIDNDDDERLSKVAVVVLQLLKPKHRTTTEETPAGVAYVELLDRAREYFDERTPEAFERMTCSGEPMPPSKPAKFKKRRSGTVQDPDAQT
jgi:hypothetical protein